MEISSKIITDRMTQKLNRIVVIPSDPLEAYQKAGYDWLERYYNPAKVSREVFCVSPYEKGEFQAFGMKVIGITEKTFRSVVADIRPDAIRAYSAFYPAELACKNKIPGIPTLVSVHDTTNLSPLIVFADMVICVSSAVAKEAMKLGVHKDRIRILPNRVDRNVFQCKHDVKHIRDQFPEGKLILHVGRKSEQKNLETVIQALTLLPREYFCVFVGRGDTLMYQELAEKSGVINRTHWVDSVKNSELPDYYSMCDCMCTPSRWEGFGIVFIEAAACEAGIITSDIAPMNEFLVHNENAYLVKDYESPQALAEGIQKVCEDRAYRQRLGANARTMTEHFDVSLIDKQEAAFYRESLTLKPNPKKAFGLMNRIISYGRKKFQKIIRKLYHKW